MKLSDVALYGILFLFLFQLLADFIEAVYAFGLLATSLTVEVASALLLLSPLALLLFRRGPAGWSLVLLGELALASRLVEVMLDTRGKMLAAGFGAGCFLVFFPALLRNLARDEEEAAGSTLGAGLILGLSLSVLFRALGSGSDLSTAGWFQAVGWLLAVVAGLLLPGLVRGKRRAAAANAPPDRQAGARPAGFGRVAGLSLGLTGVWIVIYFAFMSPNVIARWTGASYELVVSLLVAALALLAWLFAARPPLLAALTRRGLLLWNGLFVAALVLTILAQQIAFPADPAAYPLPEPPAGLLHALPLLVMLLTFPVILVDFTLFGRELIRRRPSNRALGGGFALAGLFLLVMIFAHVFTTVYAYIPVVGPLFRDKFWLVYLVAGLAPALPLLLVEKSAFDFRRVFAPAGVHRAFPAAISLIGAATIAGVALTGPRPAEPPAGATQLKILTYNVQQGYDEDGLRNYDGQLAVLRAIDADVIGLQESDTNRLAGGNADLVRYFADALDLHSYYGPKTVPGTFGIALLSKYPLENPRTFYLYSAREQTAAIEARISVGGRPFTIVVTHLGNGGPIVQQEGLLRALAGRENLVVMGDFNFRPGSDQYRLTTETLADAWLLKWPEGVDSRGHDPAGRVDHVFVSPGLAVTGARFLTGPESDHPALIVDIGW